MSLRTIFSHDALDRTIAKTQEAKVVADQALNLNTKTTSSSYFYAGAAAYAWIFVTSPVTCGVATLMGPAR